MTFAMFCLTACSGPPLDEPKDPADTDTDTDADTDVDPRIDADQDGFSSEVDCDDQDDTVFPGAVELCGDGRITDCDRTSEDGVITVDGISTPDLQSALASAADGDTVLVCPGTYLGAVTSDRPVHLVGVGGADVTILDAELSGTVLSLPGGSSVTGLTVTRGSTTGSGGGIELRSGPSLEVRDCVIVGNSATDGGGLSIARDSAVTIAGTVIRFNLADGGGGLWVSSGSSVDLTGSSSTGNTARFGGGVVVDGASLVGGAVTDNATFLASSGLVDGGGIMTFGASSLTDIEIADNEADDGGGVGVADGTLAMSGVYLHDNAARVAGGGLTILGDLVLDPTSEITANTAALAGGGVEIVSGTLTGGVVQGNESGLQGGGIFAGVTTIEGVTILDNAADYGGGITLQGGGTVIGGRIAGNRASIEGGGVRISGGVATFEEVEIADNAADVGGGLIAISTAEVTLDGGAVERNQATAGGGAVVRNGAVLRSVATDWGEGADDNAPSDVLATSEHVGYGATATFECVQSGCDPLP